MRAAPLAIAAGIGAAAGAIAGHRWATSRHHASLDIDPAIAEHLRPRAAPDPFLWPDHYGRAER